MRAEEGQCRRKDSTAVENEVCKLAMVCEKGTEGRHEILLKLEFAGSGRRRSFHDSSARPPRLTSRVSFPPSRVAVAPGASCVH
eukprot:763842-Hanusia_phi.AAC.3